MSGYTISTPDTILTTQFQDGQGAGAITPSDARNLFASAMSVGPSTKTASYTLVLTDAWLCIEYNSSSAGNLLIPTDASVAFQIGTVIEWFQLGTGQLTIVAVTPGTTTVRNSSSNTARAQGSSGAIRKRAANDWVLMGDLT
jgi:hypothetical protein